MAGVASLEWEAVAQAKRSGHGQATDAHLVVAALGTVELPAELVETLRARSGAILAGIPVTFETPELTESARTLLAQMTDLGAEPALRAWLLATPEPSTPATDTARTRSVTADSQQSQTPDASAPAPGMPARGQRSGAGGAAAGPAQLTEEERAQILASAQADLDGLIGLLPVKEHINQLVNWTVWNRARAQADLPTEQQSLHMVFTGPPGTGKTTVARILGRMFHGLGVLRTDRFVEVSRTDLVAEHVGGTALKTKAALERALDGVLFIDEAYSLTPEGMGSAEFGQEAVATILAYMENNRDRIVVIAAGYDKEMGRFLDSNPGLRSRFGTVLDFPRYSPDELLQIFAAMAQERQLDVDPMVLAAARQRIERVGGGNARNVRMLLEQGTRRMANRAMADGRIEPAELRQMVVSDLLGGPDSRARQQVLDEAMADLRSLVGLESVKARIADLVSRQAWSRARVAAGMTVPEESLNLVFSGPPGTGKTTVARIVARIYQGLGLLDRGQLVEVTRKDLAGQYIGTTAPKTQAALDRARGGILFIDEAYSLVGTGNDYGSEALSTIVSYLEDNRGSVALILAGYPKEMTELLSANPGLRSRVGATINFSDYTPSELLEIFAAIVAEQGLECGEGVRDRVAELLGEGAAAGAAGNARYVRSLVDQAVGAMASRANADGRITDDELRVLTVDDIPEPAKQSGFGFGPARH